jgi:hypothetical protein
MGSLSNFAELELLDHVFNAAYSPPAAVYLALCTADPTDAGTGASMNEVANTGSYARTAITFGAASARRITQNALVTFPQATGFVGHHHALGVGRQRHARGGQYAGLWGL